MLYAKCFRCGYCGLKTLSLLPQKLYFLKKSSKTYLIGEELRILHPAFGKAG
jgi:hypothetical protein